MRGVSKMLSAESPMRKHAKGVAKHKRKMEKILQEMRRTHG